MVNPPRVLQVFKSFYPDTLGGIEETIAQLSRLRFQRYGVRNTIFSLSPAPTPKILQRPEYTVVRCKQTFRIASTPVSGRIICEFRRLARSADVIHYHYPWPIADILHIIACPPCRTIVTYHSDIYRQRILEIFYRPWRRVFLGRVDRIVATSPNYLSSSPVLRQHAKKTAIIPIGIEDRAQQMVPEPQLEKWRRRAGTGFFLYLGGLRYYKGLYVLLAAVEGLAATLVVAGAGEEGARLRRIAIQRRLHNVVFENHIDDDDKHALFRLCRGFVLPSLYRTEAFGIVLAESAMFGVPMITTELGTGTSFVNVDGHTGLVVPPNDVQALRAAIRKLSGDGALSARLGTNARRRYEELFEGAGMVTAYENEYQTLSR